MTGNEVTGGSSAARRVEAERTRRGWSIRQASARAAAVGQILSNTQWGAFEKGETELSPKIRAAVAAAFDWDDDWPENLPTRPPAIDELRLAVGELAAQVKALAELSALRDEQIEQRAQILADVETRLDRLERERPG